MKFPRSDLIVKVPFGLLLFFFPMCRGGRRRSFVRGTFCTGHSCLGVVHESVWKGSVFLWTVEEVL